MSTRDEIARERGVCERIMDFLAGDTGERETFGDLDDVLEEYREMRAELRATREERDALRALFGEPVAIAAMADGACLETRTLTPNDADEPEHFREYWETHPTMDVQIVPLYALNTEPESDDA